MKKHSHESSVDFFLTIEEYNENLYVTIKAAQLFRKKQAKELPTEASALISLPTELLECCELWQHAYHDYYREQADQQSFDDDSLQNPELEPVNLSGSFTVKKNSRGTTSPNVRLRRLKNVEKKLLDDFFNWINSGRLLKIRNYIYATLGISQTDASILDREKLPRKVNVFLECRGKSAQQLRKLPWLTWSPLPETVLENEQIKFDIFHTRNSEHDLISTPQNVKLSKRFLVLVGNDELFDFDNQKKIFKQLQDRELAIVQYLEAKDYEEAEDYINALKLELSSSKGWTALVVIAHGNDQDGIGQLQLSSNITFPISVIDKQLIIAKDNGLQFAFLSCCRGGAIADFLIRQGFHQVMFMSEKVNNGILDNITKIFVDELIEYASVKNIRKKIVESYDKSQEITPSIHLIPQIFYNRSSDAEDFQLRIYSKPQLLLKSLFKLRPKTTKETVLLCTLLLFSALSPIRDLGTDSRLFLQAIIRSIAPPIISSEQRTNNPPVQIISIDQDSINDARNRYPDFQTEIIDRRYLADIIQNLNALDSKIIVVNYLLDQNARLDFTEVDTSLQDSIYSLIEDNQAWLVFAAVNNGDKPLNQYANLQWSFWADNTYFPGRIDIPSTSTCEHECPMGFSMARLYLFSQWLETEDKVQQATILNRSLVESLECSHSSRDIVNTNNCAQTNNSFKNVIKDQLFAFEQSSEWSRHFGLSYLDSNRPKNVGSVWHLMTSIFFPYSIIDYSVSPNSVYEKISAQQFLQIDADSEDSSQTRYRDRVVMIDAGDYRQVEKAHSSLPMAMRYWCSLPQRISQGEVSSCDRLLTSGEIHAYATYQYLQGRNLRQVSFFWMTVLGIIIAKSIQLKLAEYNYFERKKYASITYGIVLVVYLLNLGVFFVFDLFIPLLIPGCTILMYTYLYGVRKNASER